MFTTDKEQLASVTAENRIWQGIPAIAVTKNGRIFVSFYSGGTKEEIGNYVLLLKSDDGAEFSEPIAAAIPDSTHRCYDEALWIDPLGRLWFIWARYPDEGVFAVICDNPDAKTLSFGEEFYIGKDVMLNKPTVLSGGEWAFPIAVWAKHIAVLPRNDVKDEETGAFMYVTKDNGKTFEQRGGARVYDSVFDEHMFLENDDKSITAFVRTRYGIGSAKSYDGGYTWNEDENGRMSGPCSRIFIGKTPSGRTLLINHHNFTERNNLTAFLSEDGGKTWPYTLLLDERSEVAYPDVDFDSQGNIYITYDRERGAFKDSLEDALESAREILLAKISEEDIISGKIVTETSYLKHTVSKLGNYNGNDKNPFGK